MVLALLQGPERAKCRVGLLRREGAQEAMALLMSEAPPDEQSGDTHLSTHKGGGREQAQLLAEYWAPILRGKADAGELHVYVSAMQRCMQTVDPLMKELGATATIEPRICEVPGLCAPEDRAFYEREVFPRNKSTTRTYRTVSRSLLQ